MTSPPAAERTAVIEPRRLARALWLEVERLMVEQWDTRQYRVTGAEAFASTAPHDVTVTTADGERCDCADHVYRGSVCKHVLRVRLLRGDREMLRALRLLIPFPL